MKLLVAIVLVTALSACTLYEGPGGGDDVCFENVPARTAIDPSSGLCESTVDEPPCPCNAACIAPVVMPDWPACGGPCAGLAEQTCLATPGCHAAYADLPTADRSSDFLACWTLSVVQDGGGCTGLSADACALHDDCESVLSSDPDNRAFHFDRCAPEQPSVPCDQVSTEQACVERTDCDAIYIGTDCTCDEQGRCQCQTETYDHCQPR